MIIKEQETSSELKKVEETTTVEKIKCDVCGHAYDSDDWDGHEFAVNPGIDKQYHSIAEVADLFKGYHTEIPRHLIDDGYDGTEMNFDVPKKNFLDVLNEEIPIVNEVNKRSEREKISMAGLKEDYADKIGTRNFYLTDGTIHHFMYELQIEESADEYKHVCCECKEVIFDGG